MSANLSAVIFDMDGVLIDSEPYWREAELEVFGQLGLPITLEQTYQTTGLRIDQVVAFWYAQIPWPNYDNHATSQAIIAGVIERIHRHGHAMAHVTEALAACRRAKLKIGLATASSSDIIATVMAKLNIGDYFDAISSAESLSRGKPHPEVYLNCAAMLDIVPERCLAVEDSFNGLIAARAASMHTLVIPAPVERHQSKWAAAHHQGESLAALAALLPG